MPQGTECSGWQLIWTLAGVELHGDGVARAEGDLGLGDGRLVSR